MDLWVNAGARLPTYYNFLPPGFVLTGPPINGNTTRLCELSKSRD